MTVDDEGNIIVADSRNHRIQIFSSSGTFVKKFGEKGTRPGEIDTPQVCGDRLPGIIRDRTINDWLKRLYTTSLN